MRDRPVVGALVALAAVLASAQPGASASEPDVRRVTLGAINVIRAEDSVVASVRLGRPARISQTIRETRVAGPTEDIDIVGRGRAVAVVLIADPLPKGTLDTPGFFVSGRFATCDSPGCTSRDFVNFRFPGGYAWQKDAPQRIPAGDYRLYVVNDGSPVTVTIKLDGPRGTVRLDPTAVATVDVETPRPTVFSREDRTVYSAGANYHSGSRGIVVGTIFGTAETRTRFDYGICYFGGLVPPPPEVAYGPGCEELAGAAAAGYMTRTHGLTLNFMTDYNEDVFPPSLSEERGFGGWLSTPIPMASAGSQGFLLTLE